MVYAFLMQDDITLRIFSFLDAISLCKVRRVCHSWNLLSTDEILWKHKLMADVRTWKHVSSTFNPEGLENTAFSTHDVQVFRSYFDIVTVKLCLANSILLF